MKEGVNTIAEYTYDALNRRITRLTTDDGRRTAFIYDESQVIEEYVDGQFERSYVYGLYIDDPVMMENAAGEE